MKNPAATGENTPDGPITTPGPKIPAFAAFHSPLFFIGEWKSTPKFNFTEEASSNFFSSAHLAAVPCTAAFANGRWTFLIFPPSTRSCDSSHEMLIRDARPPDLTRIVGIYNHAILHSTATFDIVPFLPSERLQWFGQFGTQHPLLVCEEEGELLGYACYFPFRPKPGYDTTKETSIYIAPEAIRRGIGTLLYSELITRATSAGVHALVAILGGDNPASVALHLKFGFNQVGHYPQVGRKFDQWVDTYTYLKILHD